MARLRLGYNDAAILDCLASLKLNSKHLKGYFLLSQGQLAIGIYKEALENALTAHRLCAETNDKSLTVVTAHVLLCKKEHWEQLEKSRFRETGELETELLDLMDQQRTAALKTCTSKFEHDLVTEDWDKKITLLRSTFENSRSPADKTRRVPDWAIDEISFAVMIDPVMVSGILSLLRHLREYLSTSICA